MGAPTPAAPHSHSGLRFRNRLVGAAAQRPAGAAPTAAKYAGRLLALVRMAHLADEGAVAQSKRWFYSLSFGSYHGETLPWSREVLKLIEEIALERLPEHLTERWPKHRRARIDIFVGDDYAGRGIGTEAIRRMIHVLIDEQGHHRITIDPAVENEAAIRSYEWAGLRRVGVCERAYRESASGEWRDELLMELVVEHVGDS